MRDLKQEEENINRHGFIEVKSSEVDFISKMQKSGKYFLDLAPDPKENPRWIIRNYPNYKIAKSMLLASWIAGLSTFGSLSIASISLFKECNESRLSPKAESIQQMKDSLQSVKASLIELKTSIETIKKTSSKTSAVLPTVTTKH